MEKFTGSAIPNPLIIDYGYNIPSNHFNSCVGSVLGVAKIVQKRMEDKEKEKLEDQRSISNGQWKGSTYPYSTDS
jgi:hypothetical protein